jgi:hypothetical protein
MGLIIMQGAGVSTSLGGLRRPGDGREVDSGGQNVPAAGQVRGTGEGFTGGATPRRAAGKD